MTETNSLSLPKVIQSAVNGQIPLEITPAKRILRYLRYNNHVTNMRE